MDYNYKYLKYYTKSNDLKTNNGIEYTKDIYDKTDKDKFPFYCENDKKYLCNINTPNYGLCKSNLKECDTYTGENTLPTYDDTEDNKNKLEFGKKYGYNLYGVSDKNCAKIIENSSKEYDGTFKLPKIFKIMTYNLWYNFKYDPSGDKEKNEFYLKLVYVFSLVLTYLSL